jgi:hypothetical protein
LFPQGFDFSTVTEAELEAVADELNEGPCKRFDFASPTERLRLSPLCASPLMRLCNAGATAITRMWRGCTSPMAAGDYERFLLEELFRSMRSIPGSSVRKCSDVVTARRSPSSH